MLRPNKNWCRPKEIGAPEPKVAAARIIKQNATSGLASVRVPFPAFFSKTLKHLEILFVGIGSKFGWSPKGEADRKTITFA